MNFLEDVLSTNKPLPRTALEPVCEALAGAIRRQRTARGWSLSLTDRVLDWLAPRLEAGRKNNE